HRLAQGAWTGLVGVWMSDERAGASGQRRQLIFDEWAEETARLDRWEDGVAGLLQTQDGLRVEVRGGEARRAPVALFPAPRVDQHDVLDAERRGAGDDAVQNFRTRQRQNERERQRRRRIAVEC